MRNRILLSVLWMFATLGNGLAEVGSVARIGETGEFLELEHRVNGQVSKEALPLYRADGVRYFSAGVGLEERTAEYPPFSLKLVFTAGGKPYLSGVAVTVQPATKGSTITIPSEHITGPWLFIELAPGLYHIAGTYGGQTQSLKGIKVEAGKQKTLHLRWPEDRGVGNLFPAN